MLPHDTPTERFNHRFAKGLRLFLLWLSGSNAASRAQTAKIHVEQMLKAGPGKSFFHKVIGGDVQRFQRHSLDLEALAIFSRRDIDIDQIEAG